MLLPNSVRAIPNEGAESIASAGGGFAYGDRTTLVTLNTTTSNRETFNVVRGAIDFKFKHVGAARPTRRSLLSGITAGA